MILETQVSSQNMRYSLDSRSISLIASFPFGKVLLKQVQHGEMTLKPLAFQVNSPSGSRST